PTRTLIPHLPTSSFSSSAHPRPLHSFPTRRSSDLRAAHNDISLVKGYHTARSEAEKAFGNPGLYIEKFIENPHHIEIQILGAGGDRKSTRLNSSHDQISYAVFCLKKKKKKNKNIKN